MKLRTAAWPACLSSEASRSSAASPSASAPALTPAAGADRGRRAGQALARLERITPSGRMSVMADDEGASVVVMADEGMALQLTEQGDTLLVEEVPADEEQDNG